MNDKAAASNFRLRFLLGFVACAALIGFALYSQNAWGLNPCPLCIFQRGIAGRHVYLTHLPPDQVPSCGPPLDFMMEASPLADVVKQVLTGSGECAKVDWTFLGLSMPAWALLWFVLLTLWIGLAAFRRR